MAKNPLVAPVVKWVGGKRQLMKDYRSLFPKTITSYCEPFLGGGAVLFELKPKVAFVNDINSDLIEMYEVIRDNVSELISVLQRHKNEEKYFYEVRNLDRDKTAFEKLNKVERAARIIFLNKTCYNGLFRVNNSGEFNSPYGFYKNPDIVNEVGLKAVSKYFSVANITFTHTDYAETIKYIKKGSFVYMDPPYDPVSNSASFTGYTRGGFDREEQIRLRFFCDDLDEKGVKFMLSNSATDFILDQYNRNKYNITIVKAPRNVNSNGAKRGLVDEVVVRNYE